MGLYNKIRAGLSDFAIRVSRNVVLNDEYFLRKLRYIRTPVTRTLTTLKGNEKRFELSGEFNLSG